MTDLERLHTDAVLTMGELAAILKLHKGRKPSLDRRAAYDLVRTGKLRLVNPNETNTTRWTVTTQDVRTYLRIDTP
jgi:transposase